ncbi:MAG TPA: hypothetical protein VF407_23605, partial [Polyangiaceae bacterium]
MVAAAAGGVLFACSSGDDAAAPGSDVDGGADATAGDGAIEAATPSSTIAITLHRTTAGIDVVVKLATEAGPDSTTVPTLTVTNGAASPITKGTNAGEWTCSLVPSAKDVLVEVTAAAYGITAKKTALVLDHVDDSLGQAELVGGLVNTNGVEDGANVSPDGEWLIVASYVPIDFYSCLFAGATMDQSACSTITGPYAAPERPGMLGASRIHGGTYDSHCPSLGITAAQTHAFFPTAAFVFHRQADGTFAEPHVLGADADGCLGPYGYSFAGAPTGTTAGLVFAEDDPLDSPDTKADLYFLSATLGQDNVWGRYAVDGGSAQLFDMKATRIPPVLPTTQGNPALSNGVLAWDDEDQSGGARDLWFAP